MSDEAATQSTSLEPNPSPAKDAVSPWYIVAVVLGLLVAGGAGFLGGEMLESDNSESSLAAVTESAANRQSTIGADIANGTSTAESFTPTPTSTMQPTATATPEMPMGVVSVLRVDMLSEADTANADILRTLNQGEMVVIAQVYEGGNWYVVEVYEDGGGLQGFVPANAIDITGGDINNAPIAFIPSATPSAIPTMLPSPTFTPTHTPTPTAPILAVRPISVAVFAQRSQTSAVIAILEQDNTTRIQGITQDGEWYQVAIVINGEEVAGYVPVRDLEVISGDLSNVAVLGNDAVAEAVINLRGTVVAVREGPSAAFGLVGVINDDKDLQINAISTDGEWYQLRFDDSPTGLGWIRADAVTISGDISQLPIVAGPPAPQPEVDISIESGTGISVEGASVSSGGEVTVVNLNALPAFFGDTILNSADGSFVYTVEFSIDGIADGGPISDTNTLEIIRDIENDTLLYNLRGIGETSSLVDSSVREFLPFTIGSRDNTSFIYVENGDLCVEGTDDFTLELFLDPGFNYEPYNRIIRTWTDNVVFNQRLVEIRGLAANEFSLLGAESEEGIIEEEFLDLTFWFNESNNHLIGAEIIGTIATLGDIPSPLFRSMPFYNSNYRNFTGDFSFILFPQAYGDDVSSFVSLPPACDYLFN